MNKFKINLRQETFFINSTGSVIGDICFSVDDWYFPGEDWDDFVVVLVRWLSIEFLKLLLDEKDVVEIPFMEGDFKIRISRREKKKCVVKFIKGDNCADREEFIFKSITVPLEHLKNEIKKANEILIQIKECKELDFRDDYEELRQAYELLCKS